MSTPASGTSTPAPIRPLVPADHEPLRALNNEFAAELNWQEPDSFESLLSNACFTRTIGNQEALLVAFDQDDTYDNVNFIWHGKRRDKFVYIDRIVISPSARGKGYARALYDHLNTEAKAQGHEWVTCEIYVDPPNLGSIAFHEKLGFKEVGRGQANGKTVGYFEKQL